MWEHPAEVLLPGHFLKLKSADRRAQLSDAPAKSFGEAAFLACLPVGSFPVIS